VFLIWLVSCIDPGVSTYNSCFLWSEIRKSSEESDECLVFETKTHTGKDRNILSSYHDHVVLSLAHVKVSIPWRRLFHGPNRMWCPSESSLSDLLQSQWVLSCSATPGFVHVQLPMPNALVPRFLLPIRWNMPP
jgi:hypothetical protein